MKPTEGAWCAAVRMGVLKLSGTGVGKTVSAQRRGVKRWRGIGVARLREGVRARRILRHCAGNIMAVPLCVNSDSAAWPCSAKMAQAGLA